MNKTTIARRYAVALFGLLDPSDVESTRQGLRELAQAVHASTALKHVCGSPVFTMEEKHGVLKSLSDRLGAPSVVKDFLGQLLRKNRIGILEEIAQAFSALADEREGKHPIFVTAADQLSPSDQDWLRTQLGTLTSQKIDLLFDQDPSLIAGLQIRIGSKVYDSSVRGRLERMRVLLVKG